MKHRPLVSVRLATGQPVLVWCPDVNVRVSVCVRVVSMCVNVLVPVGVSMSVPHVFTVP